MIKVIKRADGLVACDCCHEGLTTDTAHHELIIQGSIKVICTKCATEIVDLQPVANQHNHIIESRRKLDANTKD